MFKTKSKTPLILFYGASDDLLEIEEVGGLREELNIYQDLPYMGYIDLNGKLKIHVIYDGCWSFSVGQNDEEDEIPSNWMISVCATTKVKYSTGIVIQADEPLEIKFVGAS